ncbi:hypothetical protein B566_EDAN013507 [Ephemera danica]|nr:hypothetical protein B566_EDAN013507 [Ephemera danica]
MHNAEILREGDMTLILKRRLHVTETVKFAAGAGEGVNGYVRAQFAENIGCHLDKICELLMQQCLIENDEITIERLRRFQTLLTTKYKIAVSTPARITKRRNKMNRTIRLPSGSTTYFVRAGDDMKYIVAEIDADFPETQRSTMLRKHIATMVQLFEVTEAQID